MDHRCSYSQIVTAPLGAEEMPVRRFATRPSIGEADQKASKSAQALGPAVNEHLVARPGRADDQVAGFGWHGTRCRVQRPRADTTTGITTASPHCPLERMAALHRRGATIATLKRPGGCRPQRMPRT